MQSSNNICSRRNNYSVQNKQYVIFITDFPRLTQKVKNCKEIKEATSDDREGDVEQSLRRSRPVEACRQVYDDDDDDNRMLHEQQTLITGSNRRNTCCK
jgi:hypothetical protein